MKKVFENILGKYKIAWEQRDPDLAIELFTANATYHEDPFDRKPMKGRKQIYDYWAAIPRFQKNISFSHRPVFNITGSNIWGAEWTAAYTKVKTGGRNTLFDDEHRSCDDQRDSTAWAGDVLTFLGDEQHYDLYSTGRQGARIF